MNTYITSWDKSFAKVILDSKYVAIDTETISLIDKTMVGFSIAFDKKAYYIPVRDNVLDNMPIKEAQELLQTIFNSCITVFHNSAFDLLVLYKFGIDISHPYSVHDTLLMANLVDENIRHGLKSLTKRYFHYTMTELKELCGTGKKRISFADAPKKKYLYACDDAYFTLKLFHFLTDKLIQDRQPAWVYSKIERPLLHVVADMHINGINIDVEKLKEIKDKCESIINLTETKLKIEMGDKINFSSTQQLKKYFIDERHMPVIKQSSKTGNPSMDKEVLEKYAETNAVAKTLLEYRKYSKIMSTFIPALLPSKWDFNTMSGKIYPSFNQSGTKTSRFSSSHPNFQNLPKDKNMDFRSCIIAGKGNVLVGLDFEQIELRVLAHFTQDFELMRAYREGIDIHKQTSKTCGVDRNTAKILNFGLNYGMGTTTLSKHLKIPLSEAQSYIDNYFNMYKGIKPYWEAVEAKARSEGYVETAVGRKRHLSREFNAKDKFDQSCEIRSLINSTIQGTAGEILKIAMVSGYPQLKKIGAYIIACIHDELIIECPKDKAKRAYAIVSRAMVEAGDFLSVPLEVDGGIGKTWRDIHD